MHTRAGRGIAWPQSLQCDGGKFHHARALLQVLFGPREAVDSPVQVSAIGQGIFRVYRFQEGALKLLPCSLMKKPQPAFTAHAWIIEGQAA